MPNYESEKDVFNAVKNGEITGGQATQHLASLGIDAVYDHLTGQFTKPYSDPVADGVLTALVNKHNSISAKSPDQIRMETIADPNGFSRLAQATVTIPDAPKTSEEQTDRWLKIREWARANDYTAYCEDKLTPNGMPSTEFFLKDRTGEIMARGGVEVLEAHIQHVNNDLAKRKSEQDLQEARSQYYRDLQTEAAEESDGYRLSKLEHETTELKNMLGEVLSILKSA